jgi:hypothetical protein
VGVCQQRGCVRFSQKISVERKDLTTSVETETNMSMQMDKVPTWDGQGNKDKYPGIQPVQLSKRQQGVVS